MKSSQIYNATCKYHENQFDTTETSSLCSSSMETLETLETPIPASVTSSVCSLNLNNIEPYVVNNGHDIDDIDDIQHTNNNKQSLDISIISETSGSESLHPAIAALAAKEYKALIDAPVWSPDVDKNKNKHFAKIAIDEEDYQLIIHPNKKPIKYGVHIKYETGESYDEYTEMIAPHVAAASVSSAQIDTCCNNLYKSKQSRIAAEGYSDINTTNTIKQPRASKIAHDAKPAPNTMLCHGESHTLRIAAPFIQHVSYMHCIV